MKRIYVILLVIGSLLLVGTVQANTQATRVETRSDFVQLVEGRLLTYPGIRLNVTPAGEIIGRAWGRTVTGEWRWEAGYFCRDLAWGNRELGANCQEVTLRGETIRFQSDRGTGDFADLKLR